MGPTCPDDDCVWISPNDHSQRLASRLKIVVPGLGCNDRTKWVSASSSSRETALMSVYNSLRQQGMISMSLRTRPSRPDASSFSTSD
jgi:hypothetical protein